MSNLLIDRNRTKGRKRSRGPLARILATRGNLYVQSVDFFMYIHVHMYTTCVSTSCWRADILLAGEGWCDSIYRKKRTDQPGSGNLAGNFHPSSPPRGFSRFHVSYSKITVQLVCVCVFFFFIDSLFYYQITFPHVFLYIT